MYSTVQLSKTIQNVTRNVCTKLLTRQYYGAVSTCRLLKYDSRKTPGGLPRCTPTALHRVAYINLFTPVRPYSDGKHMTTALALIKDLKNVKSSPMPALVLGASGLIPFVSAPIFMLMTGSCAASLVYAQSIYGACILSFIGGVRWGLTLPDDAIIKPNWLNLGYSITPPLVAWFALLLPSTLALTTLMVGLGGAAYMDITMWGYPAWFKAMRFLLTLTAILSLWTTILLMYTLKDSKKSSAAKSDATDDREQECWWLEDEEDPIEEFISCNDD